MSDPLLSADTIEVGKVAGSGGLGFLLAKLADRVWKKSDAAEAAASAALVQVLAEVKALTASVNALGQQTQASISLLGQQLAVLTEGTRRRDEDVAKLENTVAEQGKQLARLEAKFEEIAR